MPVGTPSDMETTAQRRPTRDSTRPLAWGVLAASVLQVIAPIITINGPGTSPGDGSGPDLLITPVGWAFAIWGVIYTLAIVQAAVVLVRRIEIPRRLQVDQIVLYLGGALWIALAGLDNSLATAGALLLMFIAAIDGVLTAGQTPLPPHWTTGLTRAAVGLYAGWVTAAFFLNASTALVDSDVVQADQLGWQIAVLVVAAAVLANVTVLCGGILTYSAAGLWALLGIGVTASSDGTTEVIWVAAAAAALLVITTFMVRLRGMQSQTS